MYDKKWGYHYKSKSKSIADYAKSNIGPKSDNNNEYYVAFKENQENLHKFQRTDQYKKWVQGKDKNELTFQTIMKRVCGHEYTGDKKHDLGIASLGFFDQISYTLNTVGLQIKSGFKNGDMFSGDSSEN